MTRKALSQMHWLSKEIQIMNERLSRYNDDHPPIGSPVITGMPGAHSNESNVERYVMRKSELFNEIIDMRAELIEKQQEAIEWMKQIDDMYLKQIISLYCMDNMRWAQVAYRMGTTPDSVRMYYKRHIGNYLQEESA